MPEWRDGIRARLAPIRLAPAREAEIVTELSQHLDDRYEELLRGGASAEEAERVALRELGTDRLAARMGSLKLARAPAAVTPVAPTGRHVADVWQNAIYTARMALRALRSERGFAAATILILTLAFAVNVTAFRVMDATLLHGYPFIADNERMVFVDERFPFPGCCVSYGDFDAWRAQARSFQGLTFGVIDQVALQDGGETRDVSAQVVSPNALRVLGVTPELGRDFRASDESPGAERVVILSHRFWASRFGGDPAAVGGVLNFDGAAATIVGVLPPGFDFPQRTDVWLPLPVTAELFGAAANGSFVFGRLADGVSEAAARAELEAINGRLALETPATNRDVQPVVTSFMRSYAGPNAVLIYGSLWAGAWLVLIIAIANVTNLTLARAQSRVRETCTRLALGAGRGRVVGQWFVESVLLAGAAALPAWVLVLWSLRFWTDATATQYQFRDYAPNLATLAYLVALALAAAVVMAVVPAGGLRRLEVGGALKGDVQGVTMTLRAKRLSALLVTGQMMLAIVLLSGAGVLGRSVWNVLRADLGIETPENVLIGRLDLPTARYSTAAARTRFLDELRARLGALVGVTSAAVANGRPVDDHEPRPVEVEGDSAPLQGAPVFAASPGYFDTIGAPLFGGRDFAEGDDAEAPPVAIVNRTFAETHFPGESAIGRRIRLYAKREQAPGEWRTIVGVAADVMQNDAFRRRFRPAVYVPFAQETSTYAWLFVRAPVLSESVTVAVRREVEDFAPGLELTSFMSLASNLGFALEARGRGGPGSAEYVALSRQAAVAPVLAAIALVLAAVGLYAVVARSVGQRTKEIGVRMALGAAAPAIRRLVLREGLAPVAVGLLLGLAASLGINRVLQSQLVGVSPYDSLTLTLASLLLLAVALLGCWWPLRRAVEVNPVVALRAD